MLGCVEPSLQSTMSLNEPAPDAKMVRAVGPPTVKSAVVNP